jgi:hypothetical protein
MKNLHKSKEEWNFISNNRHMPGNNFRFAFSLLDIKAVGDHSYILFIIYYYYYYYLWQCWVIVNSLEGTDGWGEGEKIIQ